MSYQCNVDFVYIYRNEILTFILAACSLITSLLLSKFQPVRNRQTFAYMSFCWNMKIALANYQTVHTVLFWMTTLTENKVNI